MYFPKPLAYSCSSVPERKSISIKKVHTIAVLLASMIVIIGNSSFAQNTEFKLSDYKNPSYLYRSLDLNFSLNNSSVRNHSNHSAANSFSLNSGAGAAYSFFKNSPGTQTELYASLGAGIGSSAYGLLLETTSLESTSKSFSHSEYLNTTGVKRFYGDKKYYFEINGSIGATYNGSSGTNKNTSYDTLIASTESGTERFTNNTSGAFRIGNGRIEQVQDARVALYLLDGLLKLGRIKRTATNEEVVSLSQLITTMKYKRFFDERLQKIAEITAIDSFMKQNGLAVVTDAAYFTSINDNWNYANNPARYSGKRMFTGLEADFSYSYDHQDRTYIEPASDYFTSVRKQHQTNMYLVAGLNYEKPASLKWQKSANLKAGAGIRRYIYHDEPDGQNVAPDPEFTEAFPAFKLEADYGFGYYPTSRTWLTFKWWLLAGWEKEMTGDSEAAKADNQNSLYVYTGPQFQAYYYLSEKLRLRLTFNGEFRLDNDKYTFDILQGSDGHITNTWWNQQVNAALTYGLF
jgi:hypothetical protein